MRSVLSLDFAIQLELSSLLLLPAREKKLAGMTHTRQSSHSGNKNAHAVSLFIDRSIHCLKSNAIDSHGKLTNSETLSCHFCVCVTEMQPWIRPLQARFNIILCVLHGPWHCLICNMYSIEKIHGSFSKMYTVLFYGEKIIRSERINYAKFDTIQLVFCRCCYCCCCCCRCLLFMLFTNYYHIDL